MRSIWKNLSYFTPLRSLDIWCSEPVDGKAASPEQMIGSISQQLETITEAEGYQSLWDELFSSIELSKGEEKMRPLDIVYETLTILEFTNE